MANNVPLPALEDNDTIQTVGIAGGSVETNEIIRVYPDFFPEGYNMYVTDAAVNGAEAYDLVERVNQLRVEVGEQPLTLDAQITETAMYRASEISLVYRHDSPSGLWGQSEYEAFGPGGGELIVSGPSTGEQAFDAFEGSAGHYLGMIRSWNTRIGVGQYGSAWVLLFKDGEDTYKQRDITKEELITTYTTDSRIAKTVVDQTTDDEAGSHGINGCYDPRLVVNGDYDTTKSIKLDKGLSQQMGAYIVPDPFSLTKDCDDVETKIVPSTLTWSSSNPAIASVDSEGVVTTRAAGTAVISGQLYEDTITYTIIVSDNGTIPEDIGTDYLVRYRTHVQNVGWQAYVADGGMSGTSGRSLRLEGINIALNGIDGGIEYTTHVQNVGWQEFVGNGAMAGTSGRSLRLEGIRIWLTGDAAKKYDVYYRTHTQNIGWMGWAKNAEQSGSAGYGYRLEGIEVKLVEKGGPAPGSTDGAFVER